MNIVQQNFFRFALSSHIFPKDAAESVLSELNEEFEGADENLPGCLERLNEIIKQFDLELVNGRSEITGDEFIALVQICESNITEQLKNKDKKASAYFSRLLSKIVQTEDGFITSIGALNLSSEVEGSMSKSHAQTTLIQLVQDRWLETKGEKVLLGIRSIMELQQLLCSTYPTAAKNCSLCRNAIFYGRTCEKCQSKLHGYCLDKYLERSRTCPSCKADWTADAEDDDPPSSQMDGLQLSLTQASRSSRSVAPSRAGGPSKPRGPRPSQVEEDSDDSDTTVEVSRSSRSGGPSRVGGPSSSRAGGPSKNRGPRPSQIQEDSDGSDSPVEVPSSSKQIMGPPRPKRARVISESDSD